MKYLKIRNDGELDLRLVSLMGGTTKSEKEHLIGNFGSGLKYTLSYLLRSNLSFKVFIGDKEVKITTKTEEIRDEVFDIIYVDGERTSITSNMGKDWQAWMICREIYSNALDEGGVEKEEVSDEDCVGKAGTTTFYIQIDNQIKKVLEDWDKYFIPENKEPLFEDHSYKIYPGGDTLRLYKQGVLIFEDDTHPSIFHYDLRSASINELREFRGTASLEVAFALSRSNKKVAEVFFECISDRFYEGNMDWGWSLTYSPEWKEFLKGVKIITQKTIDSHASRGIPIEEDNYVVVPKNIYDNLIKYFPAISALRIAKRGGEFYEDYDEKVENRVKQGLAILESCGYDIHPELEFRYGYFEDKRTNACVHLDDKIVMISKNLLNAPLSKVVAILIEENEHFNTGLADETREFQQHFIDLYTKELLKRNEVQI